VICLPLRQYEYIAAQCEGLAVPTITRRDRDHHRDRIAGCVAYASQAPLSGN
jgi:hypothetical protein